MAHFTAVLFLATVAAVSSQYVGVTPYGYTTTLHSFSLPLRGGFGYGIPALPAAVPAPVAAPLAAPFPAPIAPALPAPAYAPAPIAPAYAPAPVAPAFAPAAVGPAPVAAPAIAAGPVGPASAIIRA